MAWANNVNVRWGPQHILSASVLEQKVVGRQFFCTRDHHTLDSVVVFAFDPQTSTKLNNVC